MRHPGPAPNYKRRNYFIKKWLQSRFIIYYLFILIGSSVVLGVMIHRHARQAIRKELFQGHSFTLSTWEMMQPDVLRITIAVALFVILAGALATWLLSRKVSRSAGVVIGNIDTYRSTGDEKTWASVRYPPEMQNFQAMLSSGLRVHRGRMEELRRVAESRLLSMRKQVGILRDSTADKGRQAAALKAVADDCAEIEKNLDQFELG